MLLFAYAGNMDVHKFSETVPSAKKLGIAHLPGYCFAFNKTAEDDSSKANIIPSADPSAAVWGVLIEFDEREKENFYLDDPQSNDLKLDPVNCVDGDGELYSAVAFFAQPHAVTSHLLPYDWYHKKLIQLAEEVALPAEYITKISLMPFKIDPDEQRRERRLRKLKR